MTLQCANGAHCMRICMFVYIKGVVPFRCCFFWAHVEIAVATCPRCMSVCGEWWNRPANQQQQWLGQRRRGSEKKGAVARGVLYEHTHS